MIVIGIHGDKAEEIQKKGYIKTKQITWENWEDEKGSGFFFFLRVNGIGVLEKRETIKKELLRYQQEHRGQRQGLYTLDRNHIFI